MRRCALAQLRRSFRPVRHTGVHVRVLACAAVLVRVFGGWFAGSVVGGHHFNPNCRHRRVGQANAELERSMYGYSNFSCAAQLFKVPLVL